MGQKKMVDINMQIRSRSDLGVGALDIRGGASLML